MFRKVSMVQLLHQALLFASNAWLITIPFQQRDVLYWSNRNQPNDAHLAKKAVPRTNQSTINGVLKGILIANILLGLFSQWNYYIQEIWHILDKNFKPPFMWSLMICSLEIQKKSRVSVEKLAWQEINLTGDTSIIWNAKHLHDLVR